MRRKWIRIFLSFFYANPIAKNWRKGKDRTIRENRKGTEMQNDGVFKPLSEFSDSDIKVWINKYEDLLQEAERRGNYYKTLLYDLKKERERREVIAHRTGINS